MLAVDSLSPLAGHEVKYLDELFVIVAAGITLSARWRVIPSRVRPVRDVAVATLIAAAVLSSLINGVPLGDWVPGLILLIKGFVIFYVVLLRDVHAADVRWTLRFWLALASVLLGLGAVQLASGVLAGSTDTRGGIPVVASVFNHPQLFGWLSATVSLYLIAHYVVFRRWWMLALAVLFSIGTIVSGRRRSMIAIAAGLVAGAASELVRGRGVTRRLRSWAAPTVAMLIVVVVFLPVLTGLYSLTITGYVDPMTSGGTGSGAVTTDSRTASGTPARIALYEGAAAIAVDHFPLGVGLGRYASWISRIHYSDVYRQYGLDRVFGLSPKNPQFIDDTFWPQILGEAGVVGLVAYGVVVGWMGVALLGVARRRDLAPEARALVLGTGMMFAQTLVESLASTIFGSPSQVYLVMLAIAGTLSWTATMRAGPDVLLQATTRGAETVPA